jgi:hypothetical protein
MRNIFASRWAKASAAAAIAALGLVATTTGAEAGYCANWSHGRCVDWRNTGYDPGPAAALNAFGNIFGAAILWAGAGGTELWSQDSLAAAEISTSRRALRGASFFACTAVHQGPPRLNLNFDIPLN